MHTESPPFFAIISRKSFTPSSMSATSLAKRFTEQGESDFLCMDKPDAAGRHQGDFFCPFLLVN